jgi:hypothetical protein
MRKSYSYSGHTLTVGDKRRVNTEGKRRGLGSVGEVLTIEKIGGRDGSDTQIGLVANRRHEGWHNLDGNCPNGCGYWVSFSKAVMGTDKTDEVVEITGDVTFKGRKLKGRRARKLTTLSHAPMVFVEFDENIGGSSADGMGKRGHCALVPLEKLKSVKDKEREK